MRAILLSALGLAWPLLAAQAAQAASPQGAPDTGNTYEDHNQVDPRPLDVSSVAGSIHDPGKLSFPGATILLFTEQGHTLIASTKSDRNGHFEFAKVKSGLYRLVAKIDALCPANIPIKVESSVFAHRKIQITMQPQGFDTCSYGMTK